MNSPLLQVVGEYVCLLLCSVNNDLKKKTGIHKGFPAPHRRDRNKIAPDISAW
jgi:hypothetical protein